VCSLAESTAFTAKRFACWEGESMKRYLAGIVTGAVVMIGVAQAIPSPEGTWEQAPMDARSDSYLFDQGYCEKGTRIKRDSTGHGWPPSNNYNCVSKDPQTGPPPP